MFHLKKKYYNELQQKELLINRTKPYKEIIGRRHITHRLFPNVTAEESASTADTPFRIEKDVSDFFSFLLG